MSRPAKGGQAGATRQGFLVPPCQGRASWRYPARILSPALPRAGKLALAPLGGLYYVIILLMVKQKVWLKKRTTRGGGRAVKRSPRLTPKNVDREVRKNQLVYARQLLKLVLMFVLGIIWLGLGVDIGILQALPIGLVAGLLIVCLEKVPKSRYLELGVLCLAALLSWKFPIGIVL